MEERRYTKREVENLITFNMTSMLYVLGKFVPPDMILGMRDALSKDINEDAVKMANDVMEIVEEIVRAEKESNLFIRDNARDRLTKKIRETLKNKHKMN